MMDDETRHEEFVARINAYGREADEMDAEYDAREAYELDDPKSPGFHDRLADIWDSREGK
jgi:hypothetical protein